MPDQRYTEHPFPPYTYVPGRAPHPIGDPRGHQCAGPELSCSTDMVGWDRLDVYRWGVDLFNHGYYWEAHEAWEELWLLAGRQGGVADFIKALIKLAAAGVKAYEGNLAGVHRHAGRARELLEPIEVAQFGELQVAELRHKAAALAALTEVEALADVKAPVPLDELGLCQLG